MSQLQNADFLIGQLDGLMDKECPKQPKTDYLAGRIVGEVKKERPTFDESFNEIFGDMK